MSMYFRPYEGTRPFLFISYPHASSEQIVPAIKTLHDRGFRLWYDEGIPAGSDWPGNIARHMSTCSAVIFFQTEKSLASPNCFSEIRTAVRAGKPLMVIPLDTSVPDDDWQPLLATALELPRQEDGGPLAHTILESGFVSRRFHRRWWEGIRRERVFSAAAFLLLLASAALFAGAVTGRLASKLDSTPEHTTELITRNETPEVIDLPDAEKLFAVRFPDTLQERAVLEALDTGDSSVLRWQLGQLSSLGVAGTLSSVSPEEIAFRKDGACLVNGAAVYSGRVADLSLFSDMLRLEQLLLIKQPLSDLSPLNGLVLLRELYLSGSTVDDISTLQDLPSLEELHLEHCPVRNLSPLEKLPVLRTVYVTADMLPLQWGGESAAFDIILVKDLSTNP